MDKQTSNCMADLGRQGGKSTSQAKAMAARVNGAKGGRPSFFAWGKVACDIAKTKGKDIGVVPWLYFKAHFEEGITAERFAEIGIAYLGELAEKKAEA